MVSTKSKPKPSNGNHPYCQSCESEWFVCCSCVCDVTYEDGKTVGYNLGSHQINKPIPQYAVNHQLHDNGFQLTIQSNDIKDYSQVRFAVWSDQKGQDDLKWYSVSSTGQVLAPYQSHSALGTYHVHAYISEKGKMKGLTASQFTVEKPVIETNITAISKTRYAVQVTNVPAYISTVQISVWSDKKGQDDIRWYQAKKQADGSHVVEIDLAHHQFDLGTYHAHVYGKTALGGATLGLGTTAGFQVTDLGPASGRLSIVNQDTAKGTFDAVVSDIVAPGGLKAVRIPVWSQVNGQDDLHWYTATKQADGSYRVRISIAQHGYTFGTYEVHAYLDLGTGHRAGIGTTKVAVAKPTNITSIQTTYQGTGNYDVTFEPVLTAGIVKFAVWSDAGGQDDLQWYVASRQQGYRFKGNFNAQNHSGVGTYHIHAYEEVNGRLTGLGTKTIHVHKSQFTAPYFSQLDGRWSGIYYGAWTFGPTGCVPTVMAMIISGLKGTTVTPVQVGNYLHYNTMEFNRSFLGTSSRGVVLSARNWGLKARAMQSRDDMVKTLQDGHFIAAGVGTSRFIAAGGHELVLKGYSNGNTYVLDPYNPGNNGWYSIDYIWNIASTDPIDRTEGYPFIAVTD